MSETQELDTPNQMLVHIDGDTYDLQPVMDGLGYGKAAAAAQDLAFAARNLATETIPSPLQRKLDEGLGILWAMFSKHASTEVTSDGSESSPA